MIYSYIKGENKYYFPYLKGKLEFLKSVDYEKYNNLKWYYFKKFKKDSIFQELFSIDEEGYTKKGRPLYKTPSDKKYLLLGNQEITYREIISYDGDNDIIVELKQIKGINCITKLPEEVEKIFINTYQELLKINLPSKKLYKEAIKITLEKI